MPEVRDGRLSNIDFQLTDLACHAACLRTRHASPART